MRTCPNVIVMFTAPTSSRLAGQALFDMIHTSTHFIHNNPGNRTGQHSGFQMMSSRVTLSDLLRLGNEPE